MGWLEPQNKSVKSQKHSTKGLKSKNEKERSFHTINNGNPKKINEK